MTPPSQLLPPQPPPSRKDPLRPLLTFPWTFFMCTTYSSLSGNQEWQMPQVQPLLRERLPSSALRWNRPRLLLRTSGELGGSSSEEEEEDEDDEEEGGLETGGGGSSSAGPGLGAAGAAGAACFPGSSFGFGGGSCCWWLF